MFYPPDRQPHTVHRAAVTNMRQARSSTPPARSSAAIDLRGTGNERRVGRRFSFRWFFALVLGIAGVSSGAAQDSLTMRSGGMFFPHRSVEQRWDLSLGFVTFTTPEDLTEEVRVRVPAGDVHAVYRLSAGFSLEGRLLFQVVQNHLALGARWAVPLNARFSFGLGDDQAYWLGQLPVQGFNAQSSGWMNYPSVSLGFRSRGDLLFTLKAEGLISTARGYTIDGKLQNYDVDRFSGYAFSLYMEQPFFKRNGVVLGFTLTSTKFLWATWSLFQSFDRHVLYPQVTVSLIL